MPEQLIPRVYFNRGSGFLQLGPLGCFDRGEVVDVPDHGRYVVTGVCRDGLANAWPEENKPDLDGPTLSDVLRDNLAGIPATEGFGANERQARGMGQVIVANRKRNGLAPVEVEGRRAA
jgi:hypothetical protein